jgi:hypothetical protein
MPSASYERMRDRLPSLWRPDDDDASGELLPLGSGDVLAVETDPPRRARFSLRGGTVIATLDGPARLREVRILPQRALPTGCALEIYRLEGTSVAGRPALAAGVDRGRAVIQMPFDEDRFGLRLRRQGLIAMLLQTAADAIQRIDREAADVMQAHWHPHADRALLSTFYHRGRELRRLAVPRPTQGVDVVDPPALAARLRDAPGALSAWIDATLAPAARALLTAWAEAPAGTPVPPALQHALADDLDARVAGELVFDAERFAGVALDAETQALLEEPPLGGPELADLNFRLLRQGLGPVIARVSFDSPWVDDLARIGSLLALPHWREPADDPETVEEYRDRQRRVVALFRDGLGTLAAVRGMVEAQLPVDSHLGVLHEDRAFGVEENVPVGREVLSSATDGPPDGIVGPLMRWPAENRGLAPVPPTLYIQGVTPDGDRIVPTERPLVELYHGDGRHRRIGIAYYGTLAPGQTLRIRPAFHGWLGRDGGLWRAETRPAGDTPASPVPAAPWTRAAGTPEQQVNCIERTSDGVLWAVFGGGAASELWRCDRAGWARAVAGIPTVQCMVQDGDGLLIGTKKGLHRVSLWPAEGDPFAATAVPALGVRDVNALFRRADGTLLAGLADGAAVVQADDAALPFLFTGPTALSVHGMMEEDGVLHFATSRGVFRHDGTRSWWLSARHSADEGADWEPFHPEKSGPARNFPVDANIFVPPVRCVHRGPDASLWLGTAAGIARWYARPARGLTYTTTLEAWPELGTGAVHQIRQDERGDVWFCTDRGLFRHDGRDWWQLSGRTRWSRLGRAGLRYGDGEPAPRPPFRYHRGSGKWQVHERGGWVAANDRLRAARESPARAVAWTDAAAADLGTWDGTTFTPTGPADESKLRTRFKPVEERIVDGGIAAVPRLPAGTSVWRYLALEPADVQAPPNLPAWSIEGRLFPPPQRLAPYPGRFWQGESPHGAEDGFDRAVFGYAPAAKVWLEWSPRTPLTVLARLRLRRGESAMDPAVLERVWEGIRQVRPAGVRALLAVEETIVRG